MDSVAEVKLSAIRALLFSRVMSPESRSRVGEVGEQWVWRRRDGLFAGLSAGARDAGGDENFTRYDSAGALGQPLW